MKKWITVLGAIAALGFVGQSRLTAAAAAPASAKPAFEENFERGLDFKRWEPIKFQAPTLYKVVKDGTNSVLQALAKSSASGLGARIAVPTGDAPKISWRWKLDKTPPGGSEDKIKTFDHTVRLYVAFKTLIGPPRTVNYVWANTMKVGQTFDHPSSGRAKFIVLQTGDAKAGQWQSETRNVGADWKALFGKDEVPEIVSVGIVTDSDSTASTVTGWYDDIVITVN
jgi:hypothetical protein